MLRLLHTADVHLGARHADLGEQAAAQRERQFAAFRRSVDLALEERVDLFLIAGDLFDSNTQPRRSVDRVAAELRRLAQAAIRTVIIPGTHDCYDRSSIYRAHDLAALAGVPPVGDMLVVLTPDRPEVVLPRWMPSSTAGSSIRSARRRVRWTGSMPGRDPRATWHIGMIHGALSIPGMTDGDEVVIDAEEIAYVGPGLPRARPLALHAHGPCGRRPLRLFGRAGARRGAPGPGRQRPARHPRHRQWRAHRDASRSGTVGRTRFERLERERRGDRPHRPRFVERLIAVADPDLVLDVRLTGVRPDELDLDVDEVEAAVARVVPEGAHPRRLRPALSSGSAAAPDTIAGAFIRGVEAGSRSLRLPRRRPAREMRDVLRLGRLLLSGQEVTL